MEHLELVTSFPKEPFHIRTLEDERTTAIQILTDQSFNHFVRGFCQRNITFYNPVINLIEFLEVREGDERKKNAQNPTG